MISPGSIVLTRKERRAVIRLLGVCQDHLESAIDISETRREDPKYAQEYRRAWKVAEGLVKKLEAGLRL